MKKAHLISRFYKSNKYAGLIIIGIFSLLFMILEIINQRFWLADFEVYYKAAEHILAGQNLFRITEDGFYVFKYSLTSAVYFIPFTLFSFDIAKIVYWLLLTGLIIAGFYISLKMIAPDLFRDNPKKVNNIFLLAFLVLVVHIQRELHLGQVNHVLLVLYIFSLYFFNQNKFYLTSVFLALSLFIKPFALIFLPYFIVSKKYKIVFLFLIFSVVLFFIPLLFYNGTEFLNQTFYWFEELRIELNNKQNILEQANHTVFSVLVRYTPLKTIEFTQLIVKIYQVIILFIIGVLVLWFIKKGRAVKNGEIAEFALFISIIPLISFTSQNAFGFVELLVFIFLANFHKFSLAEKVLIIMGFVLTGGNIHDLWGYKLSSFFQHISLVTFGTLILISILFSGRIKKIF